MSQNVPPTGVRGPSRSTTRLSRDEVIDLTKDDPLPPPPRGSQLFARLNAGNAIHNNWVPISSHTAKCDACLKHNTTIMQRCNYCNLQLCRACIPKANNDGVHLAREELLNWTPAAPGSRQRYYKTLATTKRTTSGAKQ